MEAGEGVAAFLERIRRSPSPRIARQLATAGLATSELRLEHLSRLPPLRPVDLDLATLEDPVGDALLADAPRPVRLGCCARGRATIVLPFTAADLARVAARGAEALAAAGIRAFARVANTLEGGLETPGSLVLGDALERLGALDVPLGPVPDAKTAKAIAAMIERVGVEILVVDPASAPPLLAALAEADPRAWQGVIGLGTERHAVGAGRSWRAWLSLPETSVFFAVECREANLHLDPDVLAEVVSGTLRVSALSGDAPLLAYEPGLAVAALRSGCRCGDEGAVLIL